MIRNYFVQSALLGFSAALAVLAGCDGGVKVVNEPPKNLSISTSKCYLCTEEELTLVGSAEDDDGDPLTFTWSAGAGNFGPYTGNGATISWKAPPDPGVVLITMTVTDDFEQKSKTVEINVGEEFLSVIPAGITEIESKGYPYILKKLTVLLVPSGAFLRIKKNVEIVIESEVGGFTVYGTMVIEGTEDSVVTIKPNMCPGESREWQGIRFSGGLSEGNISYLRAYSAKRCIVAEEGAEISLINCSINSGSGAAVSLETQAVAVITGCKIWDNSMGVYIWNSDVAISASSIRYNDDDGVYISTVKPLTPGSGYDISIEGTVIANNGLDGICITGYAAPVINQCSIFYNGSISREGYAVKLMGYEAEDDILAEYNYWGDTTLVGISELIYDKEDSPLLGAYVDFNPWLYTAPVTGKFRP